MLKITGSTGRTIQLHSYFEQFLQIADRPNARFSPSQLLPVFNTYLNFLTVHNRDNFDAVIASMGERKVSPDMITYRIWLKGLDRTRATVHKMWNVLDHLNAQVTLKPTALRIDEGFLLMVADVFRRAGGIAAMERAILLLLEYHKATSRLECLRPQFYLSLLKEVMLPLDSSNFANKLKPAQTWLRMLAKFPQKKLIYRPMS
ncbi:hypothetical protein DSO57_1002897 [Entomophthora muscae]|uniref:Uncharacterized protein n=1 Tax=Entomophthora muscae TaxID=34485 RepID=A0ACC2SLI9_9FUNG|nr:hypothetical protein DSO57_1002897 [Entomophthora muscae]